jgi:hypothetical protein
MAARKQSTFQPGIWFSVCAAWALLLAGCIAAPAPAETAPPATPTESDPADDAARTLASLREVDDFPLYVMTYYGGYGFDDYLATGLFPRHSAASAEPLRGGACSTVLARLDNGEVVVGRNLDWIHRASLLLYADPPEGYASVSMVDIAYLGFEEGVPEGADASALLEAPYWPMDGMNEHGLAVTQMAAPFADLDVDPAAPTLGSLAVIRLLLDQARTVDEGIDLLRGINIDWEGGPPLHYMVADASGESALIEFIEGEMVIVEDALPWQVATNFNQYGTDPEVRGGICWRYGQAAGALAEPGSAPAYEDLFNIVAGIAGDWGDAETMWTVFYNLTTGRIEVVMGRDFEDVERFALPLAGSE